MKKTKDIENQVLDTVEDILRSKETAFNEKEIRYTIKLKSNNSIERTSELEIVFSKNSEFIDIIEFLIFHKGSVYVDMDNIRQNVLGDINEILDRY